jgi:hypothetical protein
MDRVLDAERLIDRAEQLEANGANGLRLGYVSLDAADPPAFAWLEVEFFNSIALSPLPPREAFVVEGGVRRAAGPVAVTEVHAGPPGQAVLRLKLQPIGDYSTYTLSTLLGEMDPLFNRLQFKFRPGCFNLSCAAQAAAPPPADASPAIDYLARDYDSFRHVLMSAMRVRVPGWAPTSEADLDQVLIDLVAARADELADAHDRVLNERSLATARKRVSLARHARLLDYHVHQGNQASTVVALKVAAQADLPVLPDGAWLAYSGGERAPWTAADAVVFALFERRSDPDRPWRRRLFRELNDLQLYTWGDTVTALAKGATSADLTIAGGTSEASARRLRDLLLGVDAGQTGAPPDIDAAVDRLLIQEMLNPATGRESGRGLGRRKLLHLLPGPERAEALQDPVTGHWFCRVRWRDSDKLEQNYCFLAVCGSALVRDISRFFGNLVDVTHGRPRETVFYPERAPLPAGDEDALVATRSAHWTRLARRAGATPGAAVALLPRDATIGPLAYRATRPDGDTEPRSTLVVRVSGFDRPWDERIDLIESSGTDEHYRVETDELRGSCIRFGNGLNGAPLADDARIRCRYQAGQGVAGNVGADCLDKSTEPALVLELWNPFDVVDGREPEPRDAIVRRAPEAYRRRQRRAVTLEDYAREAERVEGVAHARARYAWCGSWRAVQVAIDPVGGGRPGGDLIARLAAALDAVRLIGDDVEIRAAAYVPLDIKLVLCAHPAYWIEDLRAELQAEFSYGYAADGRAGFFHPDLWTFGQSLHASQLIGRALKVQGVDRALRVSMRRFNPGIGGGLVTVEIAPSDLPESLVGTLEIGAAEILVVANDPDRLEAGRIAFDIRGGRR